MKILAHLTTCGMWNLVNINARSLARSGLFDGVLVTCDRPFAPGVPYATDMFDLGLRDGRFRRKWRKYFPGTYKLPQLRFGLGDYAQILAGYMFAEEQGYDGYFKVSGDAIFYDLKPLEMVVKALRGRGYAGARSNFGRPGWRREPLEVVTEFMGSDLKVFGSRHWLTVAPHRFEKMARFRNKRVENPNQEPIERSLAIALNKLGMPRWYHPGVEFWVHKQKVCRRDSYYDEARQKWGRRWHPEIGYCSEHIRFLQDCMRVLVRKNLSLEDRKIHDYRFPQG